MFAATLVIAASLVGQAGEARCRFEALPFDLAAWAAEPRVEMKVVEEGRSVTYRGVPLQVVVRGRLGGDEPMKAFRKLADATLIVSAKDGYRAAVSAAAVAMDAKGERFLLALERDGQPLGAEQGPVKLIVPADPERVRWVRMVDGVTLVEGPSLSARP
jgi:hypothetical protein